jgi:hypothetical protein
MPIASTSRRSISFSKLLKMSHPVCQGKLMAMLFREYIDESESADSKTFSVGGFVGEDCVWDSLQADWLDALPVGISYFHASDCFGGNNEFEPSKGFDIPDRIRLLDKLTDLICETDIKLICHGIDVPAYKVHAPKRKVNDFLVNEYIAPFEATVQTACRDYLPTPEYPSNLETGDVCAIFVEENDYVHSAIEAVHRMRTDHHIWWRSRIGNITPGTKTGVSAIPLLQVADLGVFIGGRVISNSPNGKIPWTPYYEKLKASNRVWPIAPKLSAQHLSVLKGIQETLEREKQGKKTFWDEIDPKVF